MGPLKIIIVCCWLCRLNKVEARLKEQMDENAALQEQMRHTREALESATTSKNELQKKAQASQRLVSETRKLTADDISDLEQVPTT